MGVQTSKGEAWAGLGLARDPADVQSPVCSSISKSTVQVSNNNNEFQSKVRSSPPGKPNNDSSGGDGYGDGAHERMAEGKYKLYRTLKGFKAVGKGWLSKARDLAGIATQ